MMNRIKEVLEEKGIKKKWLAEKLDKSYNIVNGYVQNRQQPRLEILMDIAEILDVNLYTDSHSLHILSKTPLSIDPFYIEEPIPVIEEKKTISQRIVNKISSKKHIEEPPLEITFIKRTSLTQNDFEFVKQKINAISN